MKPENSNLAPTPEDFAVIPEFSPQLIFNETAGAIAHIADSFTYLVRLYTNVNHPETRLSAAFGEMVEAFRYIINNKLRYQQRRDNLPASFGIRFFGAVEAGQGYYSPYLGLLCSDIVTIEFIIREWCIYTQQYPRSFIASFGSVEAAKEAKAGDRKFGKHRAANYVEVDYCNSNPFRLQWYMEAKDLDCVRFGSVATICYANSCYFEGTYYIRLRHQKNTVTGIRAATGRRAYQHWGAIKSSKPAGSLLKRHRKPSERTTNPAASAAAKRYYELAGMSTMGFNPFIRHHIKYKYAYREDRAALHKVVAENYMACLENCLNTIEECNRQIEELKKRLNSCE